MTNPRKENCTLRLPAVQDVLNRLHTLADTGDDRIIQEVQENNPDWRNAGA